MLMSHFWVPALICCYSVTDLVLKQWRSIAHGPYVYQIQRLRLSYLDNGGLKPNHACYMQIQGIIDISGRRWCEFYVYTAKGHYQERVPFDPQFWFHKTGCTNTAV
ncbi:hypothetical protein ACJMK2_030306 [Sinanodonta woodiana]|uniref:Secreted protein n=1 Tax=Sinanodonta woodiana TaxID=1069815 RepID=A0ABD3XCU3_SINWO